MKQKLIVQDQEISIIKDDYISLTDISKSKNPDEPRDVVKNWLRNKNSIEFLGLWKKINNPDFKGVEFDLFRNEAGLNKLKYLPHMPKAFTEKGLYIIATILKSEVATSATLQIIETFAKIKELSRNINAIMKTTDEVA